MMRPIAALTALAALALALAPPAQGQQVEAPLYTNWSRFPIGTEMTLKTVSSSPGGTPVESTTTQRLVSVDDAMAVVEQSYLEPGGEPQIQTIRHRRWFPLFPGMKPEDIGKPRDPLDQGEETIELAGRTFEARWYDTRGRAEAGPMLTRTWYSDEVPGQVLKAVTRIEGTESITTIELVEIERP